MEKLSLKRALLSVTDKTGLIEFAEFLSQSAVELVSTGGTYKALKEANIPVTLVSEVTKFPEILEGRVKTLHPNIYAGILADKDNLAHLETLAGLDILPFDCICVNLYNFAGALDRNLLLKHLVEEIDIGGPSMLRAAAKNFYSVLVIPDPKYYLQIMTMLKQENMTVSLEFRRQMAVLTFSLTSQYDALIGKGLGQAGCMA